MRFHAVRRIFRLLTGRSTTAADADAELALHLELRAQELVDAGWPPQAARREALRRFGNVEAIRRSVAALDQERERAMKRSEWFHGLGQDLSFAWRTLKKAPGFTIVVVLTLALGIGANTAIFSVINAVLLRRLDYADPARLVTIRESFPGLGLERVPVSSPEFLDYRDQATVFQSVAGFENGSLTLTDGTQAERLSATRVSSNLFPMLSISPALGQPFRPEHEILGNEHVVLLSQGLWQRRFGSDPGIIGRVLQLDGHSYTVLGVMPKGFQFPHPGMISSSPSELWVPLAYTAQQRAARSNEFNTHVVARLKPGIDLRQADADVESILRRFRERYADQYPASILQRVGVVPLEAEVTGSMRSPLAILMGAVGLVLLIACANVAHLMLVRLGNRRREFAVRTALGADRSRLVRQLLTETVMVGVLGGVAGLGIAAVGVKLVVALRPGDIPRLADSHLDLVVFGFTLLLSVLTGVLVGIVPALLASRTPLGEVLKTGQRARGREQGRRTGWLVVAEVSLAVILLVGAGLLVRSFINATRADTGMASDGVLFARVYPQAAKYLTGAEVDRFYQGLMDRLGALPGVQGVAVTSNGAGEMWNGGFMIEDNARQGDRTLRGARAAVVSPGYFKTLGIPLRRGRAFAEQDRRPIPTVAVINEAMANRYWPRQDPVGKRLAWGAPDNGWLTVIGVVGDAKRDRLDEEVQPAVYVSYLEYNGDTTTAPIRSMVLALRTAGDPLALVPSLRVSLASIDPDMPVDGVRSIKQLFAESLAPRRFSTLLISVFGLTALALAAIGLYGVVSYSVVQRVPEIGVRMALGASAKDVIRMIVGQGLGFTAIGVVVGAILAVPVSSLVARLLFGVGRLDLITFAGTALVLLGAALIAAYLPARRAARIDPMSALRSE